MYINKLLHDHQISIYKLSKKSDVPYTTVRDICTGKTKLEKSSAETVYKLASALQVSVEDLLKPYLEKREDFEVFKSIICHDVKRMGDIPFIVDALQNDKVRYYYNKRWFPEALYILAMIDYLSRINQVPLCSEYDYIRNHKLRDTVYPSSLFALVISTKNTKLLKQAEMESIPEFIRFNIVEKEVRNIV